MSYFIHKQLIPTDKNTGDPNWAKRQIWVLKLNPNDSIDEFQTLEEAEADDLEARARTSSATTANPLPASPARAASIAAFRASKLV